MNFDRGVILQVVVGKSAAILELLAGKNEALFIRGDARLLMDLVLDSLDHVGRLEMKGDGLACKHT